MNRTRILVALAAALSVVFCGPVQSMAQGSDLSGGAAIVNGLNTLGPATTGAVLNVGPDAKGESLECSGVLIGCRTFLTAASCVCGDATDAADCEANNLPATEDLRVFLAHAGIFQVRGISVNPDYEPGQRHDLAILHLTDKVLGIKPAEINLRGRPDFGLGGTIVGFGSTGDGKNDAGKKRIGLVEIGSCPNGVPNGNNVCWEYDQPVGEPGLDSNTCDSDEGGPLFADTGNGTRLVGIHSSQTPQCNADAFGVDTDVYRNRDWIKEVGGADILETQCKALAQVGEDQSVLVQGIEDGRLRRHQHQKVFEFDVPANTELLRVAVNGFNKKNGNYDAFVALDRVPTARDNDCATADAGFFGACEFVAPKATKVFVLIKAVKEAQGKGLSCFQITVTAFRNPFECTPPNRPDGLIFGRPDEKLVRLSWNDNSDNEEGFILERKIGDQHNPFLPRATLPANRTVLYDHIHPDLVYTYQVAAFNECGVSRFSPICIANEPRPVRPLILRAVSVSNNGHVALKWRDRSDNESGFLIVRRIAGRGNFVSVGKVGENERFFTDTSAKRNRLYEYRVRAQGRLNECVENSIFSPILKVDTTQTFGGQP